MFHFYFLEKSKLDSLINIHLQLTICKNNVDCSKCRREIYEIIFFCYDSNSTLSFLLLIFFIFNLFVFFFQTQLSQTTCLSACKHISTSLMDKILSAEVRAISIGALEQMSLDLMQCEGTIFYYYIFVFILSKNIFNY